MNKNLHILFAFLFSLTIISCAKKSDTSSTSSTTEVEGTWTTSCFLSSLLNGDSPLSNINIIASVLSVELQIE